MSDKEQEPQVDFIGIGVPKAATSWIYQCLSEHPDICMAEPKETQFLLSEEERSVAEYAQHFQHCNEEKVRGEYSPKYLFSEQALRRIKQHYPEAKLVVCLRNPIERAISLYYYRSSKGRNTLPTLHEQIQQAPKDYIEHGKYYTHLSKYLKEFSREQIYIIVYEDIEKDPKHVIRELYDFLNVSDEFTPPSLQSKKNVTSASRIRSPFIRNFLLKGRKFLAKFAFGKTILNILKTTGIYSLGKYLYQFSSKKKTGGKPLSEKTASPETRVFLRKKFREEIRGIEKLLNRDLSYWK